MEKQIEEMAQTLVDTFNERRGRVNMKDLAESLHHAGYRKASDVARKIFEEIEKYSEVALMNGHIETPILCIGFGVLAELRKKCESEGNK